MRLLSLFLLLLLLHCALVSAATTILSSLVTTTTHGIDGAVDNSSRDDDSSVFFSADCAYDDFDKCGDAYDDDTSYYLMEQGEDMGVPQNLEQDPTLWVDIQDAFDSARQYLAEFNFSNLRAHHLQTECKNKNEFCALWALRGECQINPLFMNRTCAPMCHTCEYLLPEIRCAKDPNAVDAWQPGGLNEMFERITTHPNYQLYQPKILSRPLDVTMTMKHMYDSNTTSSSSSSSSHITTFDIPTTLPQPWVVQLDNFMTQEEADRLIELGEAEGYRPSPSLTGEKPDGTLDSAIVRERRSSSNNYCQTVCYQDPVTQAVTRRVEALTQVPQDNYEHFIMLRYRVGEHFETHGDYVPQARPKPEGVRLFATLMYLNDVEEGGSTNFPMLNITVSPKRGRVLIFPAVLNDDPDSPDKRTDHQAMPVVKGIKYAANVLVHQRNFKAALAIDCALQ